MTQSEFNDILIKSRSKLQQYAFNFTRNRDDTEDLVQETYLKALRYQPRLEDYSNIQGWLFSILHNLFINKYRRNKKQNTLIDTTPDFHYIDLCSDKGDISPESHYQEKELKERVEELKSSIRVPFKMHIEGWKYEEIGEKLGLKLGTVKSRIFFARRELMRSIDNDRSNPMKEDVLRFRKLCDILIKKGYNKNKIVLESKLTWPTFQKILVEPIEEIHITASVLGIVQNFIKKHIDDLNYEETVIISDSVTKQAAKDLAKSLGSYEGSTPSSSSREVFESGILKKTPKQSKTSEKRDKKAKKTFTQEFSNEPVILSDKEKEDLQKELEKRLMKDPLTLLTGDERFWYHLGKALLNKPSNVKLTVGVE